MTERVIDPPQVSSGAHTYTSRDRASRGWGKRKKERVKAADKEREIRTCKYSSSIIQPEQPSLFHSLYWGKTVLSFTLQFVSVCVCVLWCKGV